MLSPQALKLSASYTAEEHNTLNNCFRIHPETKKMNFVAVGGGELWGLRQARMHTKHYTCIEPLADIYMNDSVRYLVEQLDDISFIPKRFKDVTPADLPPGNSLFMFLFNILAYLEEPIESINAVIKPGDILFITTWANTEQAKQVRTSYFDYLNSFEEHIGIDPSESIGLCHFDSFPFDQLHHFKRSERIKEIITDTLIIYT